LTASGATNYRWSSQAITSAISVFPTTSNNYTVTGTDANGCVNSKTVTVNPIPNIIITFVVWNFLIYHLMNLLS
jgi:hypothetical protein